MNKGLIIVAINVLLFATGSFARAATDTTVLHKWVAPGGETSMIYITSDRSAWQYDSLQSFPSIKSSSRQPFPYGGWIEVSQYKDSHYLYYPCDIGNLYRLQVSGKAIREYGVETEDSRMLSLQKLQRNACSITVQGPGKARRTLHIYLIDSLKGLAVAETIGVTDDTRFRLLLAADRARTLPLIVNECASKADEMEFSKINFEGLLQRAFPTRRK